jgi:MscS family membrane protein
MIDDIFNVIAKPIFSFLGKHSSFIIGVVINIALIIAINKIIDTLEFKITSKLREKHSDSSLVNLLPILIKVLKAIIIFMLLAGFLQSFGYNVSSLIAGFGITGLAVGFAAKEAIGNVFGSLGLLGDRVYKIGDYIKFDNIEGYVEKINLRSTSIRTLDNFVVNVPNNTIANEAITNVSKCKKRKIDITVGVEYGTSNEKLDRAVEILKDIATNDEKIIGSGMFTSIEALADSSINIRLFAYTSETAWAKYKVIKGNVIRQIIHRFREEGIEFAFPSTSVYIEKG